MFIVKITTDQGKETQLKIDNDFFVIGRSSNCDIRIKSNSISRKHLQVYRKNSKIYVCDKKSSNGTFVNETLIPPNIQFHYKENDIIKLGNTEFKIFIEYHDLLPSEYNHLLDDHKADRRNEYLEEESDKLLYEKQQTPSKTTPDKIDEEEEEEIKNESIVEEMEEEEEEEPTPQTAESDQKEDIREDKEDDIVLDDLESLEEIDNLNSNDLFSFEEEEVDKDIFVKKNEQKVKTDIPKYEEYFSDNTSARNLKINFPENTGEIRLTSISDTDNIDPHLKSSTDSVQDKVINMEQNFTLNADHVTDRLIEISNSIKERNKKFKASEASKGRKLDQSEIENNEEIKSIKNNRHQLLENRYLILLKNDINQIRVKANKHFHIIRSNTEQNAYKILEESKKRADLILLDANKTASFVMAETEKEVEKEIFNRQVKIDDTQDEINQIQRKYDGLQNNLTNLKKSLHNLTNQYQKMDQQKKDTIQEIRRLAEKEQTLKEKLDSLDSKIEYEQTIFEEEFSQKQERSHSVIKQLNGEIEQLGLDKKAMMGQIERLSKEISDIEDVIKYNDGEKEKGLQTLKEIQEKIVNEKKNFKTILNEKSENIQQIKKIQTEIEILKENQLSLQKQLAEKKNDLEKHSEEHFKYIEHLKGEYLANINNIVKQSQEEATSLKNKAREEATHIKDLQHKEGDKIIREGKTRATQMINDAQKEAQSIIRNSEIGAEEILSEAGDKAKDIVKESNISKKKAIDFKAQINKDIENLQEKHQIEVYEFKNKIQNLQREIEDKKHVAEQDLERIKNNAIKNAKKIIGRAHETKKQRIRETEQISKEIEVLKSKADEEIKQNIEKSQVDAQKIVNNAKETKNRIQNEASNEAQKIINQAKESADQVSKEGRSYADDIVRQAREDLENLKGEISHLMEEKERIRNQSEDLLSSARMKAQKLLDEAEQKASNYEQRSESDINERRVQQQKELAEKKLADMEDLKKHIQKEVNKFETNRNALINSIVIDVNNALTIELTKSLNQLITHPFITGTTTEIDKALRKHLTQKEVADEHKERLKDYISDIDSKGDTSKKFWKNAVIITTSSVFALILLISFSEQIAGFLKNLIKSDKTASEFFVEKIRKEKANRPKFNPDQTLPAKDNYTDNVIYTKNYVSNMQKDDFQKAWILKLDKFFVDDLELSEEKGIQFLKIETRLIKELVDLKAFVSPLNPKKGIKEMRAHETLKENKIKKIVETEYNYDSLKELSIEFYNNFYKIDY